MRKLLSFLMVLAAIIGGANFASDLANLDQKRSVVSDFEIVTSRSC